VKREQDKRSRVGRQSKSRTKPASTPKPKQKAKRSKKSRTPKKPATWEQLSLDEARRPDGQHGGWRPGAGRKPRGLTSVPHRVREKIAARYPVLVTWRLVDDLPSLRRPQYADIIVNAIASMHSELFRITDYSIQTNHVHAIAEAADAEVLADAMQRLASRIVHKLNRAMRRKGRVFKERYHDRPLTTPRQVRNGLRYVLNNARRHGAKHGLYYHPDWIDPFSSGAWFEGWLNANEQMLATSRRRVTAEPTTWLRRVGWRRWGLIETDEIPGRP
jgi:hypothetical protein